MPRDAALGGHRPGRSSGALVSEFCWAIAPRFARAEPRRRVHDYLTGLLAVRSRRNSHRLAELAGEARADGMQRLLTSARWDEDAVCDDLRRFVVDQLLDGGGGVLTLVEEGFVRRGHQSVGVARQPVGVARQARPGTARVENCQVGLFLAFAPPGGVSVLVDRELYLPLSWTESRERRRRGRVPDGTDHQSRQQLAARMFERTLGGPLPVRWVFSDLPYGASPRIRTALEHHQTPYLLGAEGDEPLVLPTDRPPTHLVPSTLVGAGPLVNPLHQIGPGGVRHAWVQIPLRVPRGAPVAYRLLVRQSSDDPAHRRYYLCHVARGCPLREVVAVADPGPIEHGLRLAREHAGLSRYEVQTWRSWYRHVTLSMAAQVCLALGSGDGGAMALLADRT